MLRLHIVATQCIVPKRQSYFKISTNAFNFFTQNVHVGSRFAIDAAYKCIFLIFYHQFHCDTFKNVISG